MKVNFIFMKGLYRSAFKAASHWFAIHPRGLTRSRAHHAEVPPNLAADRGVADIAREANAYPFEPGRDAAMLGEVPRLARIHHQGA